ncbi:MAG: FAD:protein FMN transferase [Bacteroidota bacterium]
MKTHIWPLYLTLSLVLSACVNNPATNTSNTPQIIQGETMGTYYRVTYRAGENTIQQSQTDSLLVALNMEVSTYIPEALISRFNYGDLHAIDAETMQAAPHFLANLELALDMADRTENYFNPTIMPLVNYWGFGYTPKKPVTSVDSSKVDSLMQFVGVDKIDYDPVIHSISAIQLDKASPGTQIDFSAIAKGYGVDLLAAFLDANGIKSYLVDIGGEVRARGYKDEQNTPWRIGIAIPKEEASPTDMQTAVPLENAAIATSGNYRNFYELDGQKFSHTINPFTGYPERSMLLSASILAKDCATADGLATAAMVAGLEKAYTMVDEMPGIEGYFIYGNEQGELEVKMTAGFAALFE